MSKRKTGFFSFTESILGGDEVTWDNEEHILSINLASTNVAIEIQTEGHELLPIPHITIGSAEGLGWDDSDIPIYDANGNCVAHYNDQNQIMVIIGDWLVTMAFRFYVSDLSFIVSTAVN